MRSLKTLFIIILSRFVHLSVLAQGIRGTVKNSKGETLPNASIFITELKTGSSSNGSGQYAVKLPSGKFTVSVCYLGYKSQQFEAEIQNEWVEKDFILPEQEIILKEVSVGKNKKEDFAYTIMRKAIAKKTFHRLQYNSFQMTAYIKGTGELKKAPFFIKNKLKKEGLKLGEAYTTESVSQFKFSQPNKIEEKVISVRTKGENTSTISPSTFINQSFYSEKIGASISPLAKTAFVYYKFLYEGSFTEKDLIVYKIKVIPRSKGDNVFAGFIYIIDEHWAIHSIDFSSSVIGFPIKIKQNYAEVAPAVWMPVTHQFRFAGNMLGFAGELNYLVSCNNYKVDLNRDLITKTEIIDEKVDEVPNDVVKKQPSGKREASDLLASDKPMTRKQYFKVIEKYEKEALKERKEPQVVSENKFSIDKLASKRDSSYWDSIRPVPLTIKEQKGYFRDDSLGKVQLEKKKDSLGVGKKQEFKLSQILTGGRYRLSKKTHLTLDPTLFNTQFNTVEGVNSTVSANLKHKLDTAGRSLNFAPTLRYGFSGEKLYGKGRLTYGKQRNSKAKFIYLEGGSFVEQYNSGNPISPYINSASTLLNGRNHMKLYEKQYIESGYSYSPSAFVKLNGSMEWSQRNQLFNTNNYSFFNRNPANFTPNAPQNLELETTLFPKHQALTFTANVSFRPLQHYRIINDKKVPLLYASPEITLSYTKGINHLFSSDVDYDKLELGLNHSIPVGAGDRLEFELLGGSFLNNNRTFFMDYHHFDANRTSLTSLKPAGSFRLLDYYTYSTNNSYFSGHTHYSFRKFLVTRIPELRYIGLKENIFINYLKTSYSPNYYELGYSLDNVFRILRLETAAAFTNGTYKEFGVRIGVTTLIRINK